MLFKNNILAGIRDGSVTLAFRRWKRAAVKPGSQLHTPVGLVGIHAITPIAEADITNGEALCAGHISLEALFKELNGFSSDGQIYRIELSRIGDDPREALREENEVDDEQLEDVRKRLHRLDQASSQGAWTALFLRLVSRRPGVRAAELAAEISWDTDKLKLNVRKLKNLGLTISLGTGYRISPRGAAVMKKLGIEL